jgi:hypothetical protein
MRETRQLVKASQEVLGLLQNKIEAVALPNNHVHRGAGKAFVNSIREQNLKPQLLLGGERTVNEALRQAI